jgi:DNA-directed RNA polymerase subunit beta'
MAAAERREYIDAQDQYGADAFTAGIGAEAIREILMAIDLRSCAKTCGELPSPRPN